MKPKAPPPALAEFLCTDWQRPQPKLPLFLASFYGGKNRLPKEAILKRNT
jgi:hypothetical protein